jgi:hypothetical protein
MYRFYTADHKKLSLGVDGRGVTFIYRAANGHASDAIQVDQDWLNINSILSKLRKSEKYSAMDNSLSVWRQGEELHVNLRAFDRQLEETLIFGRETAAQFMHALGTLPCPN